MFCNFANRVRPRTRSGLLNQIPPSQPNHKYYVPTTPRTYATARETASVRLAVAPFRLSCGSLAASLPISDSIPTPTRDVYKFPHAPALSDPYTATRRAISSNQRDTTRHRQQLAAVIATTMRFACFSAAAVADEAEAGARHHHHRSGGGGGRRHRGTSSSLRSKLFGGRTTKAGSKKYSSAAALDDVYDAAEWSSSSVPWSSTSALSLDSARSSSSSSSTTTTAPCSRSRSLSSLSDALSPPAARRAPERRGRTPRPAAGVAAVIVCLVMVMLCGRVGATAVASAAFYLFPRRWRPVGAIEAAESAAASPEHDWPSSATDQETTTKRKVVKEGFLARNCKK